MLQPWRRFNLICLILSGLFLLGTMFVIKRFSPVEVVVDVEVVALPVIENIEIKQVKEEVVESVIKEVEKKVILVEKINLAVPFTTQAPEKNWEQPWQNACEEAAVLMLDAFDKGYNLSPLFAKDEILKMVDWEEEQGWGTSLPVEKVQELIENFVGKKAEIRENPTVEKIKELVSSGKPVLVLAYGKALPNPHYRGDGPDYHALIIRGYTEDKFITNDPGTQWGENFTYYYDDLLNAIHDWNGGDVVNGRKVILIIAL